MGSFQVLTGREHPRQSHPCDGGAKFDLHVIFTNPSGTRSTLEAAVEMARDLGARITVLVAHVVPYPLPLAEPSVSIDFIERTLESMASGPRVETSISVF